MTKVEKIMLNRRVKYLTKHPHDRNASSAGRRLAFIYCATETASITGTFTTAGKKARTKVFNIKKTFLWCLINPFQHNAQVFAANLYFLTIIHC